MLWPGVGQSFKIFCREGVNDRDGKKHRCDNLYHGVIHGNYPFFLVGKSNRSGEMNEYIIRAFDYKIKLTEEEITNFFVWVSLETPMIHKALGGSEALIVKFAVNQKQLKYKPINPA